jgi:hypothetical protein
MSRSWPTRLLVLVGTNSNLLDNNANSRNSRLCNIAHFFVCTALAVKNEHPSDALRTKLYNFGLQEIAVSLC